MHSKPYDIAQALHAAATAGLDRLDAQLLLLHALARSAHDRAWLLAHDTDPLPPAAQGAFDALCAGRRAGLPVAYLVGEKEFFGLPLAVDARVLVPRPDTETLVVWALDVLAGAARTDAAEVLDLGTGSGAIALALAHATARPGAGPAARVTALDASPDALAVAGGNARRLGLAVEFLHSDWFSGVAGRRFDLLVSNPPYIAAGDPHLAALLHEPTAALVAGADGLSDLRTLVAGAPAHLRPGGWLLLEHGWDQADAVQALLRAAGFAQVQSRSDLAGIARCTGGLWPSHG
ncbi:peptide chain release factor N(5)-glutamine methyltransferase [Xylophilus ampelinus]|uniref:Release factor glutamine methyltransferase n=1 Tax=Xylophilus ampelinus TaxID=54067 RepID=A0A318T0L0_9BURK|nr:peptide chain release factor N(5)-glutamine methyltransferase [Xylophilus ampelinus]MCS4509311.1 peptide chain release factor N(5)-glutamine methyltransferase [Xylophilus ampelinus]PYE79033.1 [protein release factor]-glutamine N5-methyltransferase [Xylophilus ampelinus]